MWAWNFVAVWYCFACMGITGVQGNLGIMDKNHEHWKGREFPKKHHWAGMNVPFYLYSGGGYDTFRDNCNPPLWSKGVEVSWLYRLEHHPWRCKNPEDALLFVIPAMFSVAMHENGTHCQKPVEDMAEELLTAVHGSVFWNRNWGRDHMLVVSYFKAQQWITAHSDPWRETMANITVATHVINNGYLKLNGYTNKVVGARYYGVRRTAMDGMVKVGENNFIVASDCSHKGVRGSLPECGTKYIKNLEAPHVGCCMEHTTEYSEYITMLASANFSLNIKGGDAGSSRTFDAILAGTPQFIISDDFMYYYAPFPCTVPWWRFSKVIKQSTFVRNTAVVIRDALELTLPKRAEMKRQQDSHRDDLLWTSATSLSANNLLVQTAKQCLTRFKAHSLGARRALAALQERECVS